MTAVSGESLVGQGGTGTSLLLTSSTAANSLSPAKSPRFLFRVLLPASSANNTSLICGFTSDYSSLTSNGAYLRIATTGNCFFVTRQGGTETTTDLGALSRSVILGFEIETADAGVTWVCRNQAGTALATHTTNVPTAATSLQCGWGQVTGGTITNGIAYVALEGTFA